MDNAFNENDLFAEASQASATKDTDNTDNTEKTTGEGMAAEAQSSSTEVATQPKGKKGAKGKVEVLGADPLHSCAFQVENLKADAARSEAKKLIAGSEFDLFKLGGVLAVVYTKEYWREYGFQDFRSYIEQEHGLQYRKAMYLINIYYGIIEYQLTWADVEGVGWTKLKTILNPVVKDVVTNENIQMWLDKAKSMTTLQLESALNGALKGPGENATEQDAGKTVTTLTFKLHADQKETIREALEKAKENGGTQVDTVALEMIALEFLNKPMAAKIDGETTQVPDLAQVMKVAGWEETLKQFEKNWPNIELSVEIPQVSA